jgi:uncharacterized protein YndB with AHSA1/START domain
MTIAVARPDLSTRPLHVLVERYMTTPPDRLFQAWTAEFDRWFAAPGSVLMRAEVNAVFFFETQFKGERHPHYGRFLNLERNRIVELTWVTASTKGAETVVRIILEPSAGGTRLNLTHSGFPDEESRKRHEDAWPNVLAKLDERMASRG